MTRAHLSYIKENEKSKLFWLYSWHHHWWRSLHQKPFRIFCIKRWLRCIRIQRYHTFIQGYYVFKSVLESMPSCIFAINITREKKREATCSSILYSKQRTKLKSLLQGEPAGRFQNPKRAGPSALYPKYYSHRDPTVHIHSITLTKPYPASEINKDSFLNDSKQ